ncbi:uncharacterized protein [Choristoneura fumiferana]|uniref:uncharacterized protein n=1 Tax=Choristoneura fumiferana TaxID=7141 RepID=UPI003D1558D5
MSKVPYVIQQDSPNLVIVPTVACYEPSPEKSKLNNTSSSTKVPEIAKVSEKSAFVNNAGVKPRVSSVNENVLIDVTKVKKQPNSWATNFLQSIGGTTSKLPRAYNWHSSASKLASLRNENIQPINYLPIARSEMYTNTTIPKTKSIKELASSKTNTSQPKPNKDFSLSNGTNVTIKSKAQCSQPKLNKEAHQSIDSKARFLPTVKSNHTKANKEAEKDATQPKPTKEAIYPKSKNELTHLISDTKKDSQTKTIFKKKRQNEFTKLSGKSDTSLTKVHDKVSSSSDKNLRKEKFKSKILKAITEKKPPKTQKSETNRENISRKK